MDSILFWVGALVVVSVLSPLLKFLIAAVAGKQIGAQALAQQPDRIRLVRALPSVWRKGDGARHVVEKLMSQGFADAGVHTIVEMPGVVVQLLAHSRDGWYAAIYEHPQAGIWFDLVARFTDGTSVTFSTSHPTALRPRPGHLSVNLPGLEPEAVFERATAQRPRRPCQPVSVADAVGVFEQGYADSMAYRKQVGISTSEVIGTAGRKAA
jgi:hypothetical protein